MNISSEKIDGESSINKDLVISRKTALVNIMVRGLSHSPNNKYHFVLRGAKRDAYDFKGSLTGNSIEYRQDGEFDSQNTLFISNLFTVFPLPDNDNLAIFIYQGEELIAIADTTQGKPIVPMVGVTNNILIDLTASLDVNIKITDWNTTYRWFEW